jgi:hypothetical protein
VMIFDFGNEVFEEEEVIVGSDVARLLHKLLIYITQIRQK